MVNEEEKSNYLLNKERVYGYFSKNILSNYFEGKHIYELTSEESNRFKFRVHKYMYFLQAFSLYANSEPLIDTEFTTKAFGPYVDTINYNNIEKQDLEFNMADKSDLDFIIRFCSKLSEESIKDLTHGNIEDFECNAWRDTVKEYFHTQKNIDISDSDVENLVEPCSFTNLDSEHFEASDVTITNEQIRKDGEIIFSFLFKTDTK